MVVRSRRIGGAATRRWLVSGIVLAICVGAAPVTLAHDPGERAAWNRYMAHQREKLTGAKQRAALRSNFQLLGHSTLEGPTNADVAFYDHGGAVGKYVYVGTWGFPCSGIGVKVIDVNAPQRPTMVALAGGRAASSHEDMVVQRIGARDILAIGLQPCGEGGAGGLALVDVTDPRSPRELSFFETAGAGVHELDLVVRPDGRALALLATPFSEFPNVYFGTAFPGEFRIIDVTDPSSPRQLSDWGAIKDSRLRIQGGNDEVSSSFQGLGYFAAHFAHSARAADRGMTAYVSYWDAGVLKFDISNPTRPRLVGRTLYPIEADGDAHSMTPYEVRGRRYILQNDEDATPLSPPIVTSSATGSRRVPGVEIPWLPTLLSHVGRVQSFLVDANDGCQLSDFRGAAGKVALIDTVDPFYVDVLPGWAVPCSIATQALNASRARVRAMLFNVLSPDDAYPFFSEAPEEIFNAIQREAAGIPGVMISDIDDVADVLRARLQSGKVRVTLTPTTPSYGFLRVYEEKGARDEDGDGVVDYRQVGGFAALPHVRGELEPPPGEWTIHNTEVLGSRAYASWYDNGIVALDVSNPRQPRLVGQFVPPMGQPQEIPFTGIWGVAIDPATGIIYGSDLGQGLWVVRPTGSASAGRR